MTSEGKQRSIFARAASGVFVAKVLGSGLGLGSQILLARLLGADSYGYYTYSIACSYLLLLAVTMGLDKGSLRFVASYLAREEPGLLRGFLAFSRTRVIKVSLTVAALAAALVWALRADLGYEFGTTALIACLLLPSSAMAELTGASLQGLRRVVLARTTLNLVRPIVLMLGVGAAYLYASDAFSAQHAMALNVGGHVCTLAILALFLLVTLRRQVPPATKVYERSEWSRISWQMALVGGLHLVVAQTDILMLGALLDTTQAGIYGVASKVATLAVFGLVAGNAIVAPMISELYATRNMARLQEVISLAAKATSVVTVVLSVGIVLFRSTVLEAFGSEFTSAEVSLLILLGGQTVNALMGPVGFIMTMTAHQAVAAKVIGLSALLNIVLNLAFIPRWGIEGAACATAISTASWNIVLAVMTRKKLGIRSSVF